MLTWRLGLDIGTNSIGWSVIELDSNGHPCRLENAGSRIFSDGRDNKSKATLKADRREARSARRRRDRFKQRQRFLLNELQKAGLFPSDKSEQGELQKLDPIQLRAKALTEKLAPYEIGRALFHLNQRRGFKSNRKDRGDSVSSGKVSNSARNLLEQMGLIGEAMPKEEYRELSKESKKEIRDREACARKNALSALAENKTLSYGGFLQRLHEAGAPIRARHNSNTKLYDVYPTRELLEDEFNKIWESQEAHHPALLTGWMRERIHSAIFTQRPLKPQAVGKCSYLAGEDRTFRAMPSFQRYRIYQEVNNLTWGTSDKTYKLIDYPVARDEIVDMLERVSTKSGQVTFGNIKKVLKRTGLAEGNFEFNLETPKRKGLDGNLTSNLMQHEDCVGPQWHEWPLEKQDEFIWTIVGETVQENNAKRLLTDEESIDCLVRNFSISDLVAQTCLGARLAEGTASLSLKATRLIAAKMSANNLIQPDAIQAVAKEIAEFANPYAAYDGGVLSRLPYYGQAFQDGRHIIPGSNDPKDDGDDLKRYGGVTNPTVHIALNQIRHVVNELIDRYGHPASIAIELGRNLPCGQERRREIELEQKRNQEENVWLDGVLQEQGQEQNRDNRLRLRLWEELDEDPNGRFCPFSGKKIGVADLFNGSTEIEHLIPFSISLDDSRANKVICARKANRDKGSKTPFQAFGDSPDGYCWSEIFERAMRLPKAKQWRFAENALEVWRQDYDDFTSRHLNDTRYIGRLTKEYLENICPPGKIDVLTGRLTALLRRQWGLNSVLRNSGEFDGTPQKKNRDDHRHHAVDAIVIGMTSRSMLQKVAMAARKAEVLNLDRLFPSAPHGGPIDPWNNFRDDVIQIANNIVVSHKPNLKKLAPGKTDGQLHNETAYGVVSISDENEQMCHVVVRWPVENFTKKEHLKSIRDPHLRREFLSVFRTADDAGEKSVDAIRALAREKGIRRMRRTENLSVIRIRDQAGKIYKAYKGDSNWGIEIFRFPPGHKKADKWTGVTISRFQANQKGFKPGFSYSPHPAAKLIMRLQVNDCIEIEKQDNEGNFYKRLLRVQKLSPGKITLAPINEANVDARNRDKDDPFQFVSRSPGSLKSLNARKVHISPTGLINYEKR